MPSPPWEPQPERAGHWWSQARNRSQFPLGLPSPPQGKSHHQQWQLLGWVPPSSLPSRADAVQRGQLWATQASVLTLVLPLTGPTTPNLNLGHEDKVKLCSRNASSGGGTDHVLGACRPLPSLSPSPTPPAPGSRLLRLRAARPLLCHQQKGGGGRGARHPLRALGPQKGGQTAPGPTQVPPFSEEQWPQVLEADQQPSNLPPRLLIAKPYPAEGTPARARRPPGQRPGAAGPPGWRGAARGH